MAKSDLMAEAKSRGIKVPLPRTLAKYGLTQDKWLAILYRQDWKCPICLQVPRIWNTDHQHVPGYFRKPFNERAKYVRGILCWRCNKNSAPSNLSAGDARRLASYLEVYENLRDLRGV